MRQASRVSRALRVTALAAVATLWGCDYPQSLGREIRYHHVSTSRAVDPATGDVVITSVWQYEDGVTTSTFKRVPRGNEERQSDLPPRPALRVTD